MDVSKYLLISAVVGVSISAALAQNQPDPCTVESTTSEIYGRVADIEARSGRAMVPLLNELQQLIAKAKDPSKSVGAQLSVHDATRFTQIADQIKSVRLSNFVESEHSRDAAVVSEMFEAAWTLYSNPASFPPPTDVPANFLVAMRVLFPNVETQPVTPPYTSCTVESALVVAEADADTRAISDPAIARDLPIMEKLKAKYPVGADGKVDASKLTPDESRIVSRVQLEMQVPFKEHRLAQDIQNILDWWRIANLVYETRKEDISTYGPDMEALGNTIEARQNTFDKRTKIMLGIWGKVNEKIPSSDMQVLNAVAPALDAVKKLIPPPAE